MEDREESDYDEIPAHDFEQARLRLEQARRLVDEVELHLRKQGFDYGTS